MTAQRKNELDLPSANLAPRLFGLSACTGHVRFAYDLVAGVKPRVLMDCEQSARQIEAIPLRNSRP